jgi:hypothetical protein
MTIAEIALIFSGVALIISTLSLWVNHLSPFDLKITHDTPTFQLYEIPPNVSGDEKGRTWWIPSFDMGITFYNNGKRAGQVNDIRIIVNYTDSKTKHSETIYFYPKWIVDYSSFQRLRRDRYKWLEGSIIREWFPITVKGNDESYLHVILEADRWETKRKGEISLAFQVHSSQHKEWKTCADYTLSISEQMFGWYSWTPFEKKLEQIRKL